MFKRIHSGIVAYVAAGVVAGAFAPSRAGAQDIVPSGPPLGAFTAVGLGWYSDVGQSFLAGGAYMNSFSFWFGPSFATNFTSTGDAASGVDLIPYVMAWNGTGVVGNVLFQGDAVTVAGLKSYTEFDFSTGNLALAPGQMYIAFVQAANDGVHTGNVRVGTSLTGSGAAADNIEGQPVNPLTDPWALNNPRLAVTFAADFSNTPVTATPEPATVMLVATGMAGVFGTGRLRRRRQ